METKSPNLDTSPKSKPQINTYHCICSTLLLATTHNLNSLQRRVEPALDRAYILPIPPPSRLASESTEKDEAGLQATESADVGYSLLLSTTQDRKPTIVRRDDGFEKRILLRCGRCKLVMGYKLDAAHFIAKETGTSSILGEDGKEAEVGTVKAEVMYLLPDGLVGSEDLKSGKSPEIVDRRELASKST